MLPAPALPSTAVKDPDRSSAEQGAALDDSLVVTVTVSGTVVGTVTVVVLLPMPQPAVASARSGSTARRLIASATSRAARVQPRASLLHLRAAGAPGRASRGRAPSPCRPRGSGRRS